MTRRPRYLAATLAAAALVAAGCTSDDGDEPDDGTAEPVQVTYITAFGAQGRDAFAWVAQERGIFEANGLEVEIVAGAGTGPNLEAITAGEADFTAMDMTGATIEAGNGNHTEFRVIAAIHQSTLVAIISLDGYGITAPQDLEGQKLGAAAGSVNQLLFPAYAAIAGVDDSTVEWEEVAPPELPGLLASRDVAALSTFLIGSRGVELAAEGTPSVVLPYSEYLTDLFGNAIMATTALVEEQPEVVVRFRDAMLEALAWTVDNPEEAAQILNQANPDSAVEAAVGEITSMTPSVLSAGRVGLIDRARVARSITLLQGAGLIPPGLPPEELVAFDLALTSAA
jgi:NitT/TauT family transport system substrate-binding protein